jgi:hypothetical protein
MTPENIEPGVSPTEFFVQQQNNAVYEHISGLAQSDHESDIAKEDVVSIQADDDYLMGIEDEDQEDPSLLTEQLMDQKFGDSQETGQLPSDRNMSPIPDSYKDRERAREKDHGRNKDIDSAKDITLSGRNSDRGYERPNRETSIQQSHVDDRRTRLYERDIREREREERYNRAIATDRAHDDRNFERDRRERERQDRYNKSIMEDKALLDVPRRNERDRFQREFERNRTGSRTPNAETSSNSTIRGATSRSPSDSDRDRKPPSRTRSPERAKREDRDLRPRDDVPREWEHRPPHQDFQRARQREDLPNRDRDPRIRDLSKEKELSSRELKIPDRDSVNLRRDPMDATFRRLDERITNTRRLDDPRNINIGIPDRNSRDPPLRDREKDVHYHRDQALRPEPIRREERPPVVRPKNETQNDSVFQDNRDKEPRQRNIQPNVLTEHDHRPDKRKREDIDPSERKPYYDREQRNDANTFNQRLPDYRIREKERDPRHREDYPSKDGNRAGINQDRDLTNRKEIPAHDRSVGLPDLYRPSSDRSIREYERDYRDIGVERFRADYEREIRDRTRDDHESRGDSVEKTDPHKHLYDRHQRESEKRIARDIEDDSMSRTNRSEPMRRADTERIVPVVMDNQRDNIRDYPQETHMQEDKSRDPHDQSKKVSVSEDEDHLLPHPWIKCKSSRNKDYYFNTLTRESQWNYPEIGKNRQTQSQNDDSRKDEDEPRKKIRLNESEDNTATNNDMNPQIGHENNTTVTANENDSTNKEVPLKEEISFDQQSESSTRLPRSNSNSSVPFLFSPQAPSPGMSTVFSPPHRSISSEYNERRFSADYGIQSSPRRGSYAGTQPHSPQMSSLRPNQSPFNRGGAPDLYDRNDVFRNDEFISNRSLGDPRNITSPSGNNNSGMMTPTFPGSPIRSTRSGMYNSFGIDQNASPGNRRSISAGVGRELPVFTQSSQMSRVRNVPEEERQFYSEEQSMEVEELSTNEGHSHERSETNINNQTNNGQGYETFAEQNADEESDVDAWRSDNESIEYGAAETEPVSIFLFRRADSRMGKSGVKKKFLNPRKEYEAMKAICGGKGMYQFKVSY